ncbi:hypothetical protein FGO68_gene14079 [Halteria grandinella]|uniref:Uncharacterized protein n=1 Tax=Halteria grandinella TaxID=5974 RepID=A0A8J8T5Q7_HALGN|nr:hypothetical protein FGO68_gene14079 [Halteria grandinella]
MGCTQAVQSIRKSTGLQHPIELKKKLTVSYVSLGKLKGKKLCLQVLSYAYKRTKVKHFIHQVNLCWRHLLFKDKHLIKQFVPSDKSIIVKNFFLDFGSQAARSYYGGKKLVYDFYFFERNLSSLEIVENARYHTLRIEVTDLIRVTCITDKQLRLLEWYKFKQIRFAWNPFPEQYKQLALFLQQVVSHVPSIFEVVINGGNSENEFWKNDKRVPKLQYKLKGKKQIEHFIKIIKYNKATENEYLKLSYDDKEQNIHKLLLGIENRDMMKVKYVQNSVYTDYDYDFRRDKFKNFKIRANLFWTFKLLMPDPDLPSVLKKEFQSLLTTKSKIRGAFQIQIDHLLRIIMNFGKDQNLFDKFCYRQLFVDKQSDRKTFQNILKGISKLSEVPILPPTQVRELVICRAQKQSLFLQASLIKLFSLSITSLRFTQTRPPGRQTKDREEFELIENHGVKCIEPQEYKFEAEFGLRMIALPKLSKLEIEINTIDDLGQILLYTNLLRICFLSITDLTICFSSSTFEKMVKKESLDAIYEFKDAVGRLKNIRRLSCNLFSLILLEGRIVANQNYQQLTYLNIYGQDQIPYYQEERLRHLPRRKQQFDEILDPQFSDDDLDSDYDPAGMQSASVKSLKKFSPQLTGLRVLKIDYPFLEASFTEEQYPNLKEIVIVANNGLNQTKDLVHEIALTKPSGFKVTIILPEEGGKRYQIDYIRQFYEVNPTKILKIKFLQVENFL